MTNQNSQENQTSYKCCSTFCDKLINLVKNAETRYNESDKNTKKKIILYTAGIGAIILKFFKFKKKNK